METGPIYVFGPYRQDADARTLTRRGERVPITPKAFDTLLYLVANAGRTVGREEMLRALWPDTFVEEGNLTYNISQIRKILGESAPGVPYIQTVPKQGYRFVAEVSRGNGWVKEPEDRPALTRGFRGAWAALILLVAAALMISFLSRHNMTRATTSGLVRLTSDSGLTMMPALSPDGKLVAYASDRSGEGNLDIWVQPVHGGEAIRLTRDPTDDYAPSFSPDGRTIAFRSEREGGGVYVVPTWGGAVRKIATYGRRPRFSPDGKWIAYWMGTETGDTSSSAFLVPGAGKIYIVPAAGGAPRELRPEFAAAGYPIWTLDSRHLLFLGNQDPNQHHEGTMGWWVTAIDGGPVVATGASAAFRHLGFATVSHVPEGWTPDGTAVLMSAVLADTRNIWRVPISSRDWKVSGVPERLTSGTTMDVQPSAAGDHLVFASLTGNLDVWSLPMDANRAEPARSLERLTHDAFAHAYPTVSPDGTKLAYSSRRSGNRDIWVRDLRTAKETAVSIPPGPSFNPTFSPDGNTLVYRVAEKQTSAGYAISLAAGSTERICEDCTDYTWSSDKSKLLLLGTSPAGISVLDLASKRRVGLLNHADYRLWNPRLSPCDRWISFNAIKLGRSRIFVAPVREAELVPETEWIAIADSGWDDKPQWSPVGNTLYFVSQRDGFRCVWAQRLDARKHPVGEAIAIFHAHESRRSLGNVGPGDLRISVARDKLVFNMSERTGNLWMANLDGAR